MTPAPRAAAAHRRVLGTVREGGFSVEMARHVFHVLGICVHGFALGTVTFPSAAEDLPALATTFGQQLPADRYPYLVEHITYHIDGGVLSECDFQFGLDLFWTASNGSSTAR